MADGSMTFSNTLMGGIFIVAQMMSHFSRRSNWLTSSGVLRFLAGQRHRGEDSQLLSQRKSVYEAAKMQHPHRWSGATRNWSRQEEVWLNPERETRAA
jgi:putative transposase